MGSSPAVSTKEKPRALWLWVFFAVSGILPQELPCPSFSRHRAYRAAGGSAGFHAGTCGKEGAAFGICKQAGRQDACMARAGGRVFAGRGFERGLAGACAPPRRASGGAKPCGSKRKRAPAPLFLPQRGAAAAFWKWECSNRETLPQGPPCRPPETRKGERRTPDCIPITTKTSSASAQES